MNFDISNISEIAIAFVLFIFSIIVHECAHGWVAEKCGDPTARLLGRITLNPIKHVHPFGSIVLPIMCKLAGLPPFGFAKPVPVNPYNFRHPRRDMIWVAAAGPISNMILASAGITGILLVSHLSKYMSLSLANLLLDIGSFFILINIILGVFNLIPIPPLDGSRIVMGLLPSQIAYNYSRLEPFGFVIMIGLVSLKAFNGVMAGVQVWTDHIIRFVIGG